MAVKEWKQSGGKWTQKPAKREVSSRTTPSRQPAGKTKKSPGYGKRK